MVNQGQLDAMADAETLVTAVEQFAADPAFPMPLTAGDLARILIDARYYGKVMKDGRSAARAAFRAVPGLRGE